MKVSRALFIVEGGKALELVKEHIAEKTRVAREVRALLEPLGVAEYWSNCESGVAMSVRFEGDKHPDFTKPNKSGSHPKKGTEWAAKFEAQKGYASPATVIAQAFNVPLSISYGSDGRKGWRAIGYPFSECGFLWISREGPYLMWVPDVEQEVRESEAQGFQVAEPAKSYRVQFDGCRRIEPEEWEILVAQAKLAKKRETSAAVEPA